ncbi:hypothetical protein VP249E411_P0269 [Vibrio phage 249E41-1]|nr:hypothetical protein VP249E411_P0269 [Vibrio phage 249E41-1]CAH9017579.1 hypothetical protein VP193E371_P0268 [Vibrio phage 193E37-1]
MSLVIGCIFTSNMVVSVTVRKFNSRVYNSARRV